MDVQLQVPATVLAAVYLADESLQALHGGMAAFATAVGIAVVDEFGLPDGL